MLDAGPAVDRLLDVRRSRFLLPYLARESSIAGAARELDVSVARMSYQTRRLVDVGLVEAIGAVRRAGRPITRYRSTADEYLVRLADLGDDLERFLLTSEEPLRAALARGLVLAYGRGPTLASDCAMRLRRSETDGVEITVTTAAGEPLRPHGTLDEWHVLHLDDADADALAAEISDVVRRYSGRRGRGTRLVRLAVAPITVP